MSTENAMHDIVVPVCDVGEAGWAAGQAIAIYRDEAVRVHLVNVQRPLPRHIAQFFNRDDLRDFHRDAGMRVLDPVIEMLDKAGVPHDDHVLVGHPAETIVRLAEDLHATQVVVDTPQRSVLSMLGLGSIGSQVHHLMRSHATNVPASGASRAT
jgi:nucleotide-binding universal stress UspA family protein